ncbi:transcriptional regulator with XRE-family HTH domain [Microbacterium paludicola]|uniref:Transcriptional regulator with XRE-family HTH domain n=1 Tax=Microbacterium paludicola TaxID=300019 RepID=A0ABU1I451_9MICO|nr:transcriptional regulator with XRE-family HTH domain [Microbacterium paludicola]
MTGLDQIGPRLRAARQERGLTLDELAERAGMSTSTLSRLESGKRQANLELLVPLTRQLGIRIDDLVPAEHADPRVASARDHAARPCRRTADARDLARADLQGDVPAVG